MGIKVVFDKENISDAEACVGVFCGESFFFWCMVANAFTLPATLWMWYANMKPSEEYLKKKSKYSLVPASAD